VADSSSGCDFLVEGEGLALNPLLDQFRLNAQKVDKFEPIGSLASAPLILVTNGKSKIKDLDHLDKMFDNDPTIALVGAGQVPDLTVSKMAGDVSGAEYRRTAVRSGTDGATLLMGGHIDMALLSPVVVAAYLKSGDLVALGNTSNTKITLDGVDVPPMSNNTKFKNINSKNWTAVFAAKGVNPAANAEMKAAVQCLTQQAKFRDTFTKQGYQILDGSSTQVTSLMNQDINTWTPVIQEAGLDRPYGQRPATPEVATSQSTSR
jgi:tripartite-type tricarboxylate transporter receptor subunit TctC